MKHNHLAFSLIELLVVIGIIAILAATMMVAFTGSTEKARSAKCSTNLKNLAAAVASYTANGPYPYAQSSQYIDTDTAADGVGICYRVHKGWISYLDQGTQYPLKSMGSFAQCSFACTDEEQKHYALTNGAIWKLVGGNRSCYMCPVFYDVCLKNGVKNPGWSYQMNAYFGYERENSTKDDVVYAHNLTRAERILLFAEIQAFTPTASQLTKAGVTSLPDIDMSEGNGNEKTDCCLHYKSKGGTESIGFNHLRGHQIVGHVAFADGHVETLVAPKEGNFQDVTDWLCSGKDVSEENGTYQKIDDNSNSDDDE